MAVFDTPEQAIGEGGSNPNPFAQVIRHPDGSWSIVGQPGTESGGGPGVLPSHRAVDPALQMRSIPQITSPGAGGIPGAAGLPSWLDKLLGAANDTLGLKDYLSLIPAGLSTVLGARDPRANKDLERILGLAENRVNQTEPLFQALNAMAMANLPKYARGDQ